jgi:hypothetical protein
MRENWAGLAAAQTIVAVYRKICILEIAQANLLLRRRNEAMSFAMYLLGTVVLIIGVGYVCHLAHVPERWIMAVVILLLGAGIMGAVSSTRRRDPN